MELTYNLRAFYMKAFNVIIKQVLSGNKQCSRWELKQVTAPRLDLKMYLKGDSVNLLLTKLLEL